MIRIRGKIMSALVVGILGVAAAIADVSPLKVGNEWVYRGFIKSTLYWSGPDFYRAVEHLKVKVTTRQVFPDSTVYKIRFQDSLSERAMGRFQGRDSALLRDTLMTWTITLQERGDSLIFRGIAGLESLRSQSIPGTIPSGFQYNAFFRLHSRPHGEFSDLPGAQADGHVWQNQVSDQPIYGSGLVKGWYIDNVGMYWSHLKGGGGCDGWLERELRLVSFNGKAISVGLEPPGAILALEKQAKIACSINRSGSLPAFGRALRGGGAMDMLGRMQPVAR